MGLFDEIKVEFPMPEGWQTKTFQTKDLECALFHYTITADGKLVFGDERREIEDYHGDIIFYDFDDTRKELIYFKARFTEGVCQWIRQIESDQ